MSITSFTAIVITFHDIAAISTAVIAVILSVLSYLLFIRRRTRRLLAFFIVFGIALFIGSQLSYKIFLHKPVGFEIVQAG